MRKALRRFVCSLKELGEYALLLKQLCCPFCVAAETLNRHSKLYGNDPESHQGEPRQRGQRVWCCPRGQRGGCGRSFSIYLAEVLPRHTLRASMLWRLLERLPGGGSIRSVFQALRLPLALESVYHLLHRLRERLSALRAGLSREQKPPASSQTDPLLQTVEHLRQLFAQSECPCAEFQLHFQHPLLE
jgi:hypothetical protein